MFRKHHGDIFLVITDHSDCTEVNMETKVKTGSNTIKNKLRMLLDAERHSACLHTVLVIQVFS